MAKPVFDPNKPSKPYTPGNAPKFDPDKPYKKVKPKISEKDIDKMITDVWEYMGGAGREFAGGMTANLSNFVESWVFDRDIEEIRQERAKFQEQYPASAFVLDVMGMVPTAAGTYAAISKAAMSKLARVAPELASSMMYFVTKEIGEKGAKTKYGKTLAESAAGAGIGYGLGSVMGVAGKALMKKAEKLAFKSLGPKAAEFKTLTPLEQRKMGRILLDEDVVKAFRSKDEMTKILSGVKPLLVKDPDLAKILDITDVAPRVSLIGKYSKEVDELLKKIDAAAKKEGIIVADMDNILDRARRGLADDVAVYAESKANQKPIEDAMAKWAEGYGDLGIYDMHKLKKLLGRELKEANWTGDLKMATAKKARVKLYLALKETIEELADDMSADLGEASVGKSIAATNEKLGALISANKIAESRAASEAAANQGLSKWLSVGFGSIAGGAAGTGAGGGPVGGTVGTLMGGYAGLKAQQFATKYGPQTAAGLIDAPAKAMTAESLPLVGAMIGASPMEEAEASLPIPRSADAVIENQEKVMAYLAPSQPEFAIDVMRAVRAKDRAKLEIMMPELIKAMPEQFAESELQTSAGQALSAVRKDQKVRIVDPVEQMMVIGDILNDDFLSEAEKTKKIDELNKFGTVDAPTPMPEPVIPIAPEYMKLYQQPDVDASAMFGPTEVLPPEQLETSRE